MCFCFCVYLSLCLVIAASCSLSVCLLCMFYQSINALFLMRVLFAQSDNPIKILACFISFSSSLLLLLLLRVHVLRCMSFLLPAGENRKILHEQEAEKMLIILLAHESPDVQAAAAQAIGVLCENLSCRDSIREWGEFVVSHFTGHCLDFIKGEPK